MRETTTGVYGGVRTGDMHNRKAVVHIVERGVIISIQRTTHERGKLILFQSYIEMRQWLAAIQPANAASKAGAEGFGLPRA